MEYQGSNKACTTTTGNNCYLFSFFFHTCGVLQKEFVCLKDKTVLVPERSFLSQIVIQALSLAKECYSMKLELLTNATVVDDAIRFVSQKSRDTTKSTSNSSDEDEKESGEPNYGVDQDQLEEEQVEQNGK